MPSPPYSSGRAPYLICLLALLLAAPKGDVAIDAAVDVRDVHVLQRAVRGLVTLDSQQQSNADVAPTVVTGTPGDAQVDTGDLAVLRQVVGFGDPDDDGLGQAYEDVLGLSPFVQDSDANQISDGQEDFDHDGIRNADEESLGRDPIDSDDNDNGLVDGLELAQPLAPAVVANVSTSTAFLYDSSHLPEGVAPMQTGVSVPMIDAVRVAVLRGRVLTRAGAPIVGATVRILDHPELGQTTTRADGGFDLAVNGGGILAAQYEASGHLTVQRRIDVPWQDFVMLPDVVLVPLDPAYSDIDLSAATPVQVAQGSVSTDASGSRRPVLLFKQGATAQRTLPDGSQQPITQLRVRATEYTVGSTGAQAMPGELPATSAYTYAVEYTDDGSQAVGATRVSFGPDANHVIAYLENFLGFPVATPIPNGYYDPKKGAWLAEPSGVVIDILDIASGQAVIDSNNDGQPDTGPSQFPLNDDERAALAALYPIGATLWRVPLAHFSDFNLGPTLPASTEPPIVPAPLGTDPNDPCRIPQSSTIACESQTLLESIPLTGSPFALAYASDRTPGHSGYTIDIPLRDAGALDPQVTSVQLDVDLAGRRFRYSYTPAEVNANRIQPFVWDGKDAYARTLQGRQPLTITLRYRYSIGYQSVPSFGAPAGNAPVSGGAGRASVWVPQVWRGFIGSWDARGVGLGGWTLSPHHTYDPYSRILYLGDGTHRRAEKLPDVIQPAVGGGTQTTIPPGGVKATSYSFVGSNVFGVAVAADGTTYVTQVGFNFGNLYKITRDGMLTRLAGASGNNYADGIPATQARLKAVRHVVVQADGAVVFSDKDTCRVRSVSTAGIITTIAGTTSGTCGYSGDGGIATSAKLASPEGLALGPDGSIYIGDAGNQRVRKVAPNGVITTVAGNGAAGEPIGPSAALETAINAANGLAVDASGNLYIASQIGRVWRVTGDGILRLFAGSGDLNSPLGDGGPAVDAHLANPSGLAVGPDGSVYVADPGRHLHGGYRVRRVTPDGLISTVAGTGIEQSLGDFGPAAAAALNGPWGLSFAPDGSLLVAEVNGPRVRRIASSLPGSVAGAIKIPSEDGSQLFEFDARGQHLNTRETLRNTLLYTFGYDDADRLVSITDADGNATTVEHGDAGAPTAITSPYGDRTTLEVDANGWLSAIENPAAERFTFTSGATGLLGSSTDPNQQTATYEYADGRLIKDTDRAGGWRQLAATDGDEGSAVTLTTRLGRATLYETATDASADTERRAITDPAGLTTTRDRDAAGQETITGPTGTRAVSTPGGDFRFGLAAPIDAAQVITTPGGIELERTLARTGAVDGSSVLISQTDTIVQNTRTSTVGWDRAAPVSWNGASPGKRTTTSFAGRILEEAFDARGRLAGSKLGSLHPLKVGYDGDGHVATLTQGPGSGDRVTSFSHNSVTGRLGSITDPASRVTTFDLYDAAGRVRQMTLPGNRVVGFTYDTNGNLASLTPPGRPAHVFRYTAVDQENEYEPPPLAGIPDPRTIYSYDFDRALDFVTRPDGKSVDLGYESSTGRLDTITIAEGVYDYAYYPATPTPTDPDGQLQSIAAPGGETIAFAWDGRLPLSTTWSGPVAGSVTRTFDDDFRIASETVLGTPPVSFGYDGDSLLTSAGAMTITRNGQAAGLVTDTTLGTVATSETPNAFGELDQDSASVNGSAVYSNTYSQRDALGRILAKSETIQGTTTGYGYSYTPAGQLDTVSIGGSVVRDYDYDANGKRTHVNGQLVGSYDAQDRLTSYQGTSYTHSKAGDLETKTEAGQTTTYTYDALGNLRTVLFANGMRIEYVIDGQNRRVGKKVCAAPCMGGAQAQLQQGYLYADQLRIVAELDGSNSVVSRFVYGSKANVPDYLVKGGVAYRIVSDHLGSVRLVVDKDTGAVAQRVEYDEWGNVTADTKPGFQPFGFAGGLYDRDTGLVRFGARDYDPQVGRWTSKDPIRFYGGDPNLFGYSFADPVNNTDPSGKQTKPILKFLIKRISKKAADELFGAPLADCQGFDCDHDGLPDDTDGDGTPTAMDPDDADPNVPVPTPEGVCRPPDLSAPFARQAH